MRRVFVVVWLAVVAAVLAAPRAVAQPCGHHGCGHHHGCQGCASCATPSEGVRQGAVDRRVYDPDTVTTLVRLRDKSGTPAWAGGPRRD